MENNIKKKICLLQLEDDKFSIESSEELEDTLVKMRRNFLPRNPLLELIHFNGNSLILGLSLEGCFVSYTDKSNTPPFYCSLGDRTLTYQNGGVVTFLTGINGHESEILKRNVVSFEILLRVAKKFFEMGSRPEKEIEWETD